MGESRPQKQLSKKKAKLEEIATLPEKRKDSLIMNAMVEDPYEMVDVIAKKNGLSAADMNEVFSSPGFRDTLFEDSLNKIVTPAIPRVLAKLTEGAESGDATKLKLFLQLIDKLQPDQTNVLVHNMTPGEMLNRADAIKARLQVLDGSSDG